MTKGYSDLGEFLRETGMTQADFAALVGVRQSLISRIVNGTRSPSLSLAVRISKASGVPVESLLKGRPEAA
jgi:transcriptional regulator with XRE-family HTH domain